MCIGSCNVNGRPMSANGLTFSLSKRMRKKVDLSQYPDMPSKNQGNIYYIVLNISRFIPLLLFAWNYHVETQKLLGILK